MSSDSDSDEEVSGNFENTFDQTLSTRHEYLGSDLEELRGRTVYEEGSIVNIPILSEHGVVLVPHQTLPLTVFSPQTIAMLKKAIESDATIGVAFLNVDKPGVCQVGTTAEIFEFMDCSDVAGLKIKAKGRQRFRILGPGVGRFWCTMRKVQILPDVTLPRPMPDARLTCLNRHRRSKDFRRKIGREDVGCIPWPQWILDQYDVEVLVKKITKELTDLKYVTCHSKVPKNPMLLSYWVVQSLPIDNAARVLLLSLNSVIERLQCSLRLIEQCREISCRSCFSTLASRRNIFPMSAEGPGGLFCNPGGHLHDVVTLNQPIPDAISLNQDPPSLEYTWFPGYAWTIASCARCGVHVGWLFSTTRDGLLPKQFWALTRTMLTTNHLQPRTNNLMNDDEGHMLEYFYNL